MFTLVVCLGLLQPPAVPAAPAPTAVSPAPQVAAPPAAGPAIDGAGSPTFTIPRLDAQATIDGRLDEAAWSQAVRLTGFSEYRPVDSQRASERTDVLLWYAPDALYVGYVAYDSQPGSVRATLADRDTLDRDDSIRLFLDTFNDRRRAFIFGVNPLGVQEDGVQTEGAFNAGRMFSMNGAVDLSPDYQFDSKGQLTPEGYVVELRIPFKSLRYPGSGPMRWGINVLRKTQRTGREDTWTDAKRIASFLGQAGTMEGLHDLRRGVVTEVQPFVTAAANGARGADGRFSRDGVELGPGVNVRLGFTNVSLDGTINPDFSQVESDAGQVTANERFALFYAEKRPFFLEGIELFATPNQLVYTRRIVDPTAGGKFTGKVGRTGVAVLTAADDEGDRHAWVTVARLRQDVGTDSLAGLTYTDRTTAGGFNRVAAADARIVFKKLYYVLGQAGGSWTGQDGSTTAAPMWQAEVDRTARHWGYNVKLVGYGTGFDAQSGYVPRSGIVEGRAPNRLTYYGARGALVENVTTFFGPSRIWDYEDFGRRAPIEGSDFANLSVTLRGGWALSSRVSRDFVVFAPDDFSGYRVVGPADGLEPYVPQARVSGWVAVHSVTTPAFQTVNGRVEVKHGDVAIFAEGARGREARLTATLGLRPTTAIRAEGSLVLSRLARDCDGSTFARTAIPRVKLEYQPRRSFFVRVVSEYRFDSRSALLGWTGMPLYADGWPVPAREARGLRTDALVSFEPTPGTVAFFGYGSSLARDEDLYRTSGYRRTSDGFFVKLAYLIRR